jgi:hypothetical protein
MPAKSKQQYNYMQAIIHGGITNPSLSPAKAKEFVKNVDYKSLPKRRFKKLLDK